MEFEYKKILNILALIVELLTYVIVLPIYSVFFDFGAAICFITVFYKSDRLLNHMLVKLGSISLEIFLLHYPVVIIGSTLFKQIFPRSLMVYLGEMVFLIAISIALAFLWKKRVKKYYLS